ncbi:MAG TPA: DUF3943 domain-containing protein [Pontiella sp.]|nr:DUF3943 domain-containing protein [Pontiella sp.]
MKLRTVVLYTVVTAFAESFAASVQDTQRKGGYDPVSAGPAADGEHVWPTNTYWRRLKTDPAIYETPYRITLFTPQNGEDGQRLWSQTKSVVFYGFGVAGFLAALPKQATGWDVDPSLLDNWGNNVKEGPVWDQDNWAYNYIGHTYFGGVYYQVARKSGYRQWDSFIYSLLMSTFYWEYGIESFAEIPSVQDLAVTPLLGWVYGEWAYQQELRIREQNGEVFGSKSLGNIYLFLLDPVDSLGRGVNRLAGRPLVKSGYAYFSYTAAPAENSTDHTVYLNMNFPIGGSSDSGEDKPVPVNYRDDPVDTGIVGLSLGGGKIRPDGNRGLDDSCYKRVTLGLYFSPRISSRFSYAWGEADDEGTGTAERYENYSLDIQYYFNAKRRLRPFVTAGFGELMWERDNEMTEFQLNAGLGVHYQIHPKWALQSDWINYFSESDDGRDEMLSASIVYRFGRGEHSDW